MTFSKPKRSLGQNFLIQPNIVAKIIFEAKLGISDDHLLRAPEGGRLEPETVLEIGPGRGSLTRALLSTGANVVAVEKDAALFTGLHEIFAKEIKNKKLTLVRGDILDFLDPSDLRAPISELRPQRFTVVANIPYYITGELLRKMLSGNFQPKTMTLMVQKEVARRICGEPRRSSSDSSPKRRSSEPESLLSISVKAYGVPRYAGTVGKGNFYPVPKVDSAILQIENISKDFFSSRGEASGKGGGLASARFSEEKFFSILHLAFAHKRKLLINNLSSLASKQALSKLFLYRNLNPKSRPEELTLDDWGYLVENL